MKKILRSKWFVFVALLLVAYGSSRLYYRVTGGFTIGNISSNFAYDARWQTSALTPAEKSLVDAITSQEFSYLGKGCQSYVFASQDDQYVLKFFKYQRFRPQAFLDYFAFIPAMDRYRLGKIDKKQKKLESVFASWKIAYDYLKDESGLIYVHLNKTHDLNKQLIIADKMGFKYTLNLDQMEFMIQKKADMFCSYIDKLMQNNEVKKAKDLLDDTIALIMSEYRRGLADNDHALMQNTGVYQGKPFHIDVGQFVLNEEAKTLAFQKQQLFNKTYKFRIWLHKNHPELALYLEKQLKEFIGEEEFSILKPQLIRTA